MPPNNLKCVNTCKPSIKEFKNNVSTKMLQAQMIKLNGRKGIPIVNSRTETIYRDIYEMDFNKNKRILLLFRYSLYMRYFNGIANCSIGKDYVKKLNTMLQDIIASLTEEEYNIVFNIVIPPPPPTIEDDNITTDYTFYVITYTTPANVKQFIIKNMKPNFIIDTGKIYTFDLSDPTNIGSRFCLSNEMNGKMTSGLTYINTPGTTNSKLIYAVPKIISNMQVYVFNDLDRGPKNNLLDSAYTIWGYTIPYIITNLVLYLSYNDLDRYLTKYINQNSYLSVFESFRGQQYYINNHVIDNSIIPFKENYYQYAITYGTYYLTVPKLYETTLLNHGLENCISFIGSTENKSTDYLKYISLAENSPQDGSYNFYYDIIELSVYRPFTNRLSFYSKKFGFLYGMDMLRFTNKYIYGNPPKSFNYISESTLNYDYYGLCAQNKVNIIDDAYIVFNDHTNYTPTIRYNLYLGVYLFFIPESTPITILNKN